MRVHLPLFLFAFFFSHPNCVVRWGHVVKARLGPKGSGHTIEQTRVAVAEWPKRPIGYLKYEGPKNLWANRSLGGSKRKAIEWKMEICCLTLLRKTSGFLKPPAKLRTCRMQHTRLSLFWVGVGLMGNQRAPKEDERAHSRECKVAKSHVGSTFAGQRCFNQTLTHLLTVGSNFSKDRKAHHARMLAGLESGRGQPKWKWKQRY